MVQGGGEGDAAFDADFLECPIAMVEVHEMAFLVDHGDDHVGVPIIVEVSPDRGISSIVGVEAERVVNALKTALRIGEEDVLLSVACDV